MSNGDAGSGRKPISPVKRKQLQQCFEHGNKRMTAGDHDYANEMFSRCVTGDPGNVIYAQSFIGNLRQKHGRKKTGMFGGLLSGSGSKALLKKAVMSKDWDNVIKHGAEVLVKNPWDSGTLVNMATATGEMGYDEVQLAYLKLALDANPEDPDVNRLCALELRERRSYDQAIACWTRVLKAKPKDTEAERAIADITVEKTIEKGKYEDADLKATREAMQQPQTAAGRPLTPEEAIERDIKKDPSNMAKYLELAEMHFQAARFAEAEDVIRRGYEASDNDPEMKERWLDAQARRLEHDLREMKAQYESSPSADLKTKFYETKKVFNAKTLELHQFRIERFPTNPTFRFDLGEYYEKRGLYKEAIAEYQAAKSDSTRRGVCLLALGRCFEQVKQQSLAIRHYEEALAHLSEQDLENRKTALYSTASLAFELQDHDKALKHAEELAGIDFSYKDVGDLLDKINNARQNG